MHRSSRVQSASGLLCGRFQGIFRQDSEVLECPWRLMLELAEHLGSLPEGTTHEGQGVHTAKMFRLVAKARD